MRVDPKALDEGLRCPSVEEISLILLEWSCLAGAAVLCWSWGVLEGRRGRVGGGADRLEEAVSSGRANRGDVR